LVLRAALGVAQLRRTGAEDVDDISGVAERVGDDSAVDHGHGGDGEAAVFCEQHVAGQRALGVQGGEAVERVAVVLESGAEGEA
jgi:hypothetical protein